MDILYEEGDLQFAVAKHDDNQKTDYLKVRTSIWNKPGWANVPEGQYETDEFDSSATCVVIMHKGQVIGGFRLISAQKADLLPFAEYCERKLADSGPAFEISRWCINPQLPKRVRTAAHAVMIKGTLLYLKSLKITVGYMDVCAFLFKFLGRSGIKVTRLGSEHCREDGTAFVPAALDVIESVTHLGLIEEVKACA
ncbi:GNAT family N-acetyltransferase [Candidatus Kaiserbacteria bacterium]|nr:GNAT family N-acetyltransferase [Candidatus Kaiserbacteria bacterium]